MTAINRPYSVMMLGLRGFPNVQGGVETHAEHLCPLLVEMGCKVTVLVRSPYHLSENGLEWKGVKFVPLWAPKSKWLEVILHSFIGVIYAAIKRPDILHIHAIGPAIMTLPARFFGLRVVVTHHGPDYDRQKWGRLARFVLRLGERFGMRYSNQRIVISKVIKQLVLDKYGVESILIPNGVVLQEIPKTTITPIAFGLEPCRYVLQVGRLVPEKRHLDLIEAFSRAALPGWKLAIVGASDHPDAYMRDVLETAWRCPGVVCTGFQSGHALRELYAHAGIFVLPSSHEGLPIVLLEALSFGLLVIASDIPANIEVGLDETHYFYLGDVAELAKLLKAYSAIPVDSDECSRRRKWVSERYNWHDIARRTHDVYCWVAQ